MILQEQNNTVHILDIRAEEKSMPCIGNSTFCGITANEQTMALLPARIDQQLKRQVCPTCLINCPKVHISYMYGDKAFCGATTCWEKIGEQYFPIKGKALSMVFEDPMDNRYTFTSCFEVADQKEWCEACYQCSIRLLLSLCLPHTPVLM